MAPKGRTGVGSSIMSDKKRENQKVVKQHSAGGGANAGDGVARSSSSSSVPGNDNILGGLQLSDQAPAVEDGLPYEHIVFQDARLNAVQPQSPDSSRTPPLRSWAARLQPIRQDIEGFGNAPADQDQARALRDVAAQEPSEDSSSFLETDFSFEDDASVSTSITVESAIEGATWWDDVTWRVYRFEFRFDPQRRLWICQYPGCEKTFVLQSELKKHQKSHVPPGCREWVCYLCLLAHSRRDFAIHKDLTRHLLAKHAEELGVSKGGWPCPECGLTFARKDGSDRHVQGKVCKKGRKPRRQSALASSSSSSGPATRSLRSSSGLSAISELCVGLTPSIPPANVPGQPGEMQHIDPDLEQTQYNPSSPSSDPFAS